MFFTGRSKHLPYLSDYLEQTARSQPATGTVAGPLVLLGVSAMVLMAALGTLLANRGVLLGAFVVGGVMTLAGIYSAFKTRRPRALSPSERLREEAGEVSALLHASLQRRRLHRDVHPAAAELLELAAWQWRRCNNLLESSYWSHSELPGHWAALRDQTRMAVTQGMHELIVLLRDSHQPSPKKNVIEEVVEEVFEEFGGKKHSSRTDRFPVAFQPARDLVEKMQHLVTEFERATEEVAREEAMSEQFSSSQAMDMCLNELRTIRRAEDELRQNLRG